MCTLQNLLRRCFGRELNEIESVTNINSNINSINLPVNQIVCEISSGLYWSAIVYEDALIAFSASRATIVGL